MPPVPESLKRSTLRSHWLNAIVFTLSGFLGNLTSSAQAATHTLYVALSGNDTWSGSLIEPNASQTDGPLRTIGAALDRAGSALEQQDGSVSVEMRSGRYQVNKPILLTATHSGTDDQPFILTGYKNENVTIEHLKAAEAVIRIQSAHDIVVSNLTIAGKPDFGISITGSDDIGLKRIDLGGFSKGIQYDLEGALTIVGSRFIDSTFNSEFLDSMRSPSSGSNNLLVSSTLADYSDPEPLLLLKQNSPSQSQTSALKHSEFSLREGLVAHYSFGPGNWRTDRVAGQNIVLKGEPGSPKAGLVGQSVMLKRNSIQYAPIPWNGSNLPRAVNFWYWNEDNVPRNTYFLATGRDASAPGFVLRFEKDTIYLDYANSHMQWPSPDFISNPTMLTMIVPSRSAHLSEVTLYANAIRLKGLVDGPDPIFETSTGNPHLASTPEKLNISGQDHYFDELSFWNRALTKEEVELLFNNGAGIELFPPPLIGRGGIYHPREWDWPWQVNTTRDRDKLIAIWESLKDLDIGNGVPTLKDRGFSGEPQKHLYVNSVRGNDVFGSGSQNRPFRSLQRALDAIPLDGELQLLRSTVIELAPGVYETDERISIISWGSTERWLAIRGSAGSETRPIITYSNKAIDRTLKDRDNGGEGGMDELIKIQGQYIELSGLVLDQRRDEFPSGDRIHEGAIRFFAYAGQIASNGVGCRILDTEIRNFLHAGIKGNAKGLIIDGVFIHDGGNTFHDHAIYIASEGAGSAFEVRRSLLLNSTGAATNQHKTSDGDDLPAPEGATITHNVMLGNEHFGITTAGMGGEIAHNAIGYSRWYGVHFYRSSASLTRIQNNIFVGYPDPTMSSVVWSSYNLAVAKTKEPAGVVVEGNYFEGGPTSSRRADPRDPGPWVSGTTYYTSNTVERNGDYYLCEVINNSKQVSTAGPKGTDPNSPSPDGNNIRWWFLTKNSNRISDNLLNGNDGGGRNFVDTQNGDFHLRNGSEAIGIGVDLGYSNGRNPGPWPDPVP